MVCRSKPGGSLEKAQQQEKTLRTRARARSPQQRLGEKEKLPAVAAVAAITPVATPATTPAAAITTPAATTSTTTAIAATPTTATRALRLRPRFVDDKVPAPEVLTVQARHGAVGVFIVGDFDEGETSRLSREAIPNQADCGGIHTHLPKPFLQLLFRSVERKITHIKLLHQRTPSARNLTTIAERTEESKTADVADRRACRRGGRDTSVVPCMVSKNDFFCNYKSLGTGRRGVLGPGLAPNCHWETERVPEDTVRPAQPARFAF